MIRIQDVDLNGRHYKAPVGPVIVICVDGSEPAYIEEAVAAGVMPWTQTAIHSSGANLLAECVVPSFTNPNNLSIATGVEPAVHGICGNFFFDREHNREVMMNEPELLRAGTLFEAFQRAGARIAVLTAKDKLRRLLGKGLTFGEGGAVCFSSEKSDQTSLKDNGITDVPALLDMQVPSVYSAELSEFVFAAGLKLMETIRPDLMYLSTTDYVQHKFAPGTDGANSFYAMMDSYWAKLDALGAVVAITADHGMNAKHDSHGSPNVVYLQRLLDESFGDGGARVILPITDPYVVHHGALGSFATVYLSQTLDLSAATTVLERTAGISAVYDNARGCEEFGLPPDRMGDLIVISDKHTVLGTTTERHDLSGLDAPLRSHGGISEQTVPLLLNRPLHNLDAARRLRNFDIYDVALNHACEDDPMSSSLSESG
jgi:phosphonoacetate hydrolase